MARRGISRFLRGAVNTGTAAMPLGPKIAVPAAIAGGALEAFVGAPNQTINRKPYDTAFQNYVKGAMQDTRRASRELSSQRGARLSARGINNSALGDFLHSTNNTRLYQGTLRHINDARANLESQIAHAEDMIQRSADVQERNRWANTRNMLVQKLDDYANPEGANNPLTPEYIANAAREYGFSDNMVQKFLNAIGHPSSESAAPPMLPTANVNPTEQTLPTQQTPQPVYFDRPSTQDPFDPSMRPSKSQRQANTELMSRVKSEIGDLLSDYLVETLGEDFADIFQWETN